MDPRADDAFSRAARRLGALTEQQLRECRQLQRDAKYTKSLSQTAFDNAYLGKDELFAVLAEAHRIVERDMHRRTKSRRNLGLVAFLGAAVILLVAVGLFLVTILTASSNPAPTPASVPVSDSRLREITPSSTAESASLAAEKARTAAQPALDSGTRLLDEVITEMYRATHDPRRVHEKLHAAIVQFSLAADRDPSLTAAFHRSGRARMLLGDFEQAEQDFTRALKQTPNSSEILFDRGKARLERVIQAGGLENDPDNPDAGAPWKLDSAKDFQESLRQGLKGPEGSLAEAMLALHQEGIEATLVRCSDALWTSSTNEEFHRFRGEVLLARKDWAQAAGEFSKALQLRPHYPQASFGRGMAYLAMKQAADALQDFTTCIDSRVLEERALFQRGNAHLALKHYRSAIADWQRCLDMGSPRAEKIRILLKEAESKTHS